ncbi:MAG: CoA-transferase, partial [Acidobacteriota bacterium]
MSHSPAPSPGAPSQKAAPSQSASQAELLIAALARRIEDGMVIATGVASYLAILAIAAARATHAPRLTYLACVGSLDPAMDRLEPSAESLAYLQGRSGQITIPDLFDHARRGRIDLMFFGAAEVDAAGDTNLSAAGSLDRPTYKFPGVAGAATLRRWVRRPILSISRQSQRNLVPKVQVASTSDPARRTPLYTDLGVFELGAEGAELVSRHPWATPQQIAERTGFEYRIARSLPVTS